MKINLIMPDELLSSVDARANALNITRTAYINMACSRQIQQDAMMDALPEMLAQMRNFQSLMDKVDAVSGDGEKPFPLSDALRPEATE